MGFEMGSCLQIDKRFKKRLIVLFHHDNVNMPYTKYKLPVADPELFLRGAAPVMLQ